MNKRICLLWLAVILLTCLLTGCTQTDSTLAEAPEFSKPVATQDRAEPVQGDLPEQTEPESAIPPEPMEEAPEEEPGEEQIETKEPEEQTMQITIGAHQFTVLLENNDTAAALVEQLPLQLDMSELHGNEKYNYLPFSLPTDAYAPGEIQTGDVMLYGDNCLVVFYQSFSSSYSYTKIGHITDVTDLQEAVGAGNVQMTFAK